MEEKKIIDGYENYSISDNGVVINEVTGQVKAQFLHRKGYPMVTLYSNGKPRNIFVHRLVATAFVENPFNKETINHKNEIKTDNRACNLEWLTSKENTNYGTRTQRQRISMLKRLGKYMEVKE